MKYTSLAFFMLLLLASCDTKQDSTTYTPATCTYTYADSCDHLLVSLSLELPTGQDSISQGIRDSLLADFVQTVAEPGYSDDNTEGIKHIDSHDPQVVVEHYGKEVYRQLLRMAKSDYNERMAYVESDTTLSTEDKNRIREEVPQWNYTLNVNKENETERFVTYNSQIYCYYGGAHGGVVGSGPMTFDLSTGHKIERFLRSESAIALQPLLRKGLRQYYSCNGETISETELNEHLQIEGNLIPLPQRTACPNSTADSLILTYGQYEIACYADGMPSLRLAVKDVEPYLTPEARALLTRKAPRQ